ncbi:MerR family transcriptional regulator [Isoptericola sp. F-RaC21]|uniref:MerR family transcriptional regulator n=1 Tax=Isoptericola sp. F-RaC21 TaxID=3141452 RepID=UPI00315B5DC8
MRIGEAAAAAGATPRALRFYEQQGLLDPPPRTAAGQREYTVAHVDRVRVVRQLLELGLTVADVRACVGRLHLLDGDRLPEEVSDGACRQGSAVVLRRLAALDAEIARLTATRDRLAARVRPPATSPA